MKKTISVALATLCFSQLSFSQDCQSLQTRSQELKAQIEKTLEENRQKDQIPALTYSTFTKDCLLLSGSLGASTQGQDAKLEASHSLFRLASVSKLFVSLAVLQLVEQGRLNLDSSLLDLDDVSFVKELKKSESPERLNNWRKIKIRHLLSHQAGISKDITTSLLFFNSESVKNHTYPSWKSIATQLNQVEFLFEPGQVSTGLKYSNLGMDLLAQIVEERNSQGIPYSQYLKRFVLAPLKMNQTFTDVPTPQRFQMVSGFGNLQKDQTRTSAQKAFLVGGYKGSIGLAATATDLAKLGQEHLRILSGEGALLKDSNLIHEAFQIHSPASPLIAWAMGPTWQVLPGERLEDPLWFGHTGTGVSERSILISSPERNLGIVVLFNVTDANREKYAKIISDSFKAIQTSVAVGTNIELLTKVRSQMRAIPTPSPVLPLPPPAEAHLERYTGTYYADIPGAQPLTLTADGSLQFFGQKLETIDVKKGLFRFPPIQGPAGALFNREPIQFIFSQSGEVLGLRMAHVKKMQRLKTP